MPHPSASTSIPNLFTLHIISSLLLLTTLAAGVDLNALCPAADTGKSKCIPGQPNQYVLCAGTGSIIQTTNVGIICQNGIPVYAGPAPAPAPPAPPPLPPTSLATKAPLPVLTGKSTFDPSSRPSSTLRTSSTQTGVIPGYPSSQAPYHSTNTGRLGNCKNGKDWTGTWLQYVCVAGTDLEFIRCDQPAMWRDQWIWRLPDYLACNKRKNQILDRKTQKPVREFDSYLGKVGMENSSPNNG